MSEENITTTNTDHLIDLGEKLRHAANEIDNIKNSFVKNTEDLNKTWKSKRAKMLKDMIDVTGFVVWFIEFFPESKKILIEDPHYHLRFV